MSVAEQGHGQCGPMPGESAPAGPHAGSADADRDVRSQIWISGDGARRHSTSGSRREELIRMKAMTGNPRRISIVLFDGFELLDVFGPVELFSMVPDGIAVEFVGPEAGPVASSQGAQVTATSRYDVAATPDIILIPGGQGARRLVEDEAFLSW